MDNAKRSSSARSRDSRLEALHRYDILDTPPEKAFDDIVEAASAFCDTPIALISLIDQDRQWFKACLGLNTPETPIDHAICAIAIAQADPLVIADLAQDPRTASNPLVTGGPRIRFYAGVPLVARSGDALGTVCVIDTAPRPDGLTAAQLRGLAALARQATSLIEIRSAVHDRDARIVTHLKLSDDDAGRIVESDQARIEAEERDGRSKAAQEAGRIGTFEFDVQADLAIVSPEFCRIFGLPEADSYALETIERFMMAEGDAAQPVRRNGADGSMPADVEYRIRRPSDGQIRWIAQRARFEQEGGHVRRMLGTVHDVTERREEIQRVVALLELGDLLRETDSKLDTIANASHILGRELGADRVGYATVNRAARSFAIECDWTAPGVPSLVGVHPVAGVETTLDQLASGQSMAIANVHATDWLSEDHAAYRAFGTQALMNVPLVIRHELVGVLFVHATRARSWSGSDIKFAHGVADRAYATIAQLEAEAQRNVLNLELSHRMKNMLTMVQAIANQTLRGVADRDAVSALSQRLVALSGAHDVLLEDHWTTAPIPAVVGRVLSALGVLERARIEGPPILLGPRSALTLSLLIHELATNAVKYGALSSDGGQVLLAWRVEGVGSQAILHLAWRETGGPPVTEPENKGFGSRLIGMGLLGTGGTATRFPTSGFEADFSAALDRANVE